MIAKGGQPLLDPAAMTSLKSNLLSRAAVATPNLPEAAALADMEVCDVDGMKRAAERIVGLGAAAVRVKGGHIPGDRLTDVRSDERRVGNECVSNCRSRRWTSH